MAPRSWEPEPGLFQKELEPGAGKKMNLLPNTDLKIKIYLPKDLVYPSFSNNFIGFKIFLSEC